MNDSKILYFCHFWRCFLEDVPEFFYFYRFYPAYKCYKRGCGTSWLYRKKYPKKKGVYSLNMSEYQENPSFWLILGNFLINLPDFCNFNRFSPVYDSCKGEPGSSCVYRSENIKNQKEFVHLMCGNIKKPHHFGRFRVIFSQINLIFAILTGLVLS